jgi:transcriptional regulator with XRE-family HTH domain
MTSDNPTHETADAAAETASVNPGPTVGEYLRSAREQQGLSIEDVARELRMPLQRLKLLEADDFSYLNSDTFVRGYLRAYAKLLQVDPATAIADPPLVIPRLCRASPRTLPCEQRRC